VDVHAGLTHLTNRSLVFIEASRLASPADRVPMQPDDARGKVTDVIDGGQHLTSVDASLRIG